MRTGWLIALFISAFAGEATAQGVQVEKPVPAVATRPPEGVSTRPISLTRVAGSIRAGTPWLQFLRADPPVPCQHVETIYWKETDNALGAIGSFERTFRDELSSAGYASAGDPTNLFETNATSSDLQIGALITGLRVRSCEVWIFGATWNGSAAMDVEWQIYSVSQAKVLARIRTTGGGEAKGKQEALRALIDTAFVNNVRRLTNNEEFRRILTASAEVAPPRPTAVALRLASVAAPVAIPTAVKSVVTIFAGEGHGSGVLVSSDGLILTNHHVAGASGTVRVRWSDGTDTVGEVVRGDPRRDVALVRAHAKGGPLPIRQSPVQVGETVFAVGTPLDKQFSNTLTRGIVSGTRQIEGQSVIQSDVAIDHGNSGGPLLDEQGRIIALTVSRYEEGGVGHDINFFIPINDALAALNVTPAP